MLFSPSKKSLKEIFSSGLSISTMRELMTLDLTRPFTSERDREIENLSLEFLLEQGKYTEDLLVEKGLVSHEEWEHLLAEMAETQTPLATLLVNHRIVPPEALTELAEELRREIEGRTDIGPSVRKFLVKDKILTPEQVEEANRIAHQKGLRVSQIVLEMELVTFDVMADLFKRHLNIESVDLAGISIEIQVVHLVPDNLMQTHFLLPFRRKGKKLHLAMSDPRNSAVIKKIEMMTRLEVVPYFADRREIMKRLDEYIVLPVSGSDRIKALQADEASFRELLESDSAVKMVNRIIEGAINTHATDVHIEPSEKGLRIRYRIDGMLYDIMTIPRDMGIPTVSRVKVLAGMDLTERRRAQDGHIGFDYENHRVNLRAATLPTHLGEKIVLRIHDEKAVLRGLGFLGFNDGDLVRFKQLIHHPHGMILVTGPIGSGKTTTLYTAVSEINHHTRNIVTLEDPIEYQLPGINQVQVDPKIGITFASGLRSILRQDANILLVGEIRDPETAATAVRAANTGHLLLSSMHTNNAVSAVTALQHLGVPRFQIATSLVCVVAQRLVRVLCTECRRQAEPRPLAKRILGLQPGEKIWEAVGCAACFGTGYHGRTGLFELFRVSERVEDALINGEDEKQISRLAAEEGMVRLSESGRRKVLDGVTSYDELSRIVVLDENGILCEK